VHELLVALILVYSQKVGISMRLYAKEMSVPKEKKVSAVFYSRHFNSATIAATAFRALLRGVEKYRSTVGFEPGILALIAKDVAARCVRHDSQSNSSFAVR